MLFECGLMWFECGLMCVVDVGCALVHCGRHGPQSSTCGQDPCYCAQVHDNYVQCWLVGWVGGLGCWLVGWLVLWLVG